MNITAFSHAQRYIGLHELAGNQDHPLIQWWLSLCGFPTDVHDEVAWCSAFANGMCWDLRLPRSKSAAARSWLGVGEAIQLRDATVSYDVVILKRGTGEQPGPEVINAPGHVGFYAGQENGHVNVLAGNQGNMVSVAPFELGRILGIRRIYHEAA